MGLDTYASRSEHKIILTPEDQLAFTMAGIELCGGLFSGEPGSFRGNVYATLVLDITGVSLLQHWITPETVRVMHAALLDCDPGALYQSYLDIAEDLGMPYAGDSLEKLTADIHELIKFFQVCAAEGLGLIGDS